MGDCWIVWVVMADLLITTEAESKCYEHRRHLQGRLAYHNRSRKYVLRGTVDRSGQVTLVSKWTPSYDVMSVGLRLVQRSVSHSQSRFVMGGQKSREP